MDTISIIQNPTSAFTGGTPTQFDRDGVVVAGGSHFANMSKAFQERNHVTIKSREPKRDPKTGTFSKARRFITYSAPVYVQGILKYVTVRVELDFPPEVESDLVAESADFAAQLLSRSGPLNGFIVNGTL